MFVFVRFSHIFSLLSRMAYAASFFGAPNARYTDHLYNNNEINIFIASFQNLLLFPARNIHIAPHWGKTSLAVRKFFLRKVFSSEESEKERTLMKSNNQINVPQAKQAMEQFKMQAAQEVGVNLQSGYNGHLTSREAGSVGGQMVKKMIEAYEQNMQ